MFYDPDKQTVTMTATLDHGHGDNMSTVFQIEESDPFEYSVFVTVKPDNDDISYDDFWNLIYGLQLQRVELVCKIDGGQLVATPSSITILEKKD